MVHLCSDMWLVFLWVIRISCLMEGSVCSCDGDTMQDELYSIHQSSAWLLFGTANRNPWVSFYLVNLCHGDTKQTTVSVCVTDGFWLQWLLIFLELYERQYSIQQSCQYCICVFADINACVCACVCAMSLSSASWSSLWSWLCFCWLIPASPHACLTT